MLPRTRSLRTSPACLLAHATTLGADDSARNGVSPFRGKIDLERLVQRARLPRAVDVAPGPADEWKSLHDPAEAARAAALALPLAQLRLVGLGRLGEQRRKNRDDRRLGLTSNAARARSTSRRRAPALVRMPDMSMVSRGGRTRRESERWRREVLKSARFFLSAMTNGKCGKKT